MNVLAIQSWYPSNAARFFVDAFEHLGHQVFRMGPTYFDHYGLQYAPEELSKIDIPFFRAGDWSLDAALDAAAKMKFTPDFIWLSEENYQNVITPTAKVPVVLWSADGWPNSYERLNMIQPTLAYTNHPLGVNPHPQKTIPDGWKFLPGAADSVWDVPFPNEVVSQSDFCLMATMYGPREKICQELLSQGLQVNYGQATLSEWQMFYSRAFSTYHNSNGQAECKWRMFSSMALGCINICDDNYLLDALGFIPWNDYVPISDFTKDFDNDLWPSGEAIANAIRRLRELPYTAARIAQHAQGRVHKHDRYENRVRLVFSELGLGEREEDDRDYDQELRLHLTKEPYHHRNFFLVSHESDSRTVEAFMRKPDVE